MLSYIALYYTGGAYRLYDVFPRWSEAPCAPPANPPPEIAGSEPHAPPAWDPNAGAADLDFGVPARERDT